MTNSTLANNSALNGPGGGIFSDGGGTVTVTNSTFSGNSASGAGGGIDNGGSALTVTNTILAGNGGGDV